METAADSHSVIAAWFLLTFCLYAHSGMGIPPHPPLITSPLTLGCASDVKDNIPSALRPQWVRGLSMSLSVDVCLCLSRKADAGHNTPTAGGGGEEKRGGEAGSVLWLLRLQGLSLIKPRL